MIQKEVQEILDKASNGTKLFHDEMVTLLSLSGEEKEELFKRADLIRKLYMGDEIHLRGLIEFSNYCERNCLYCGIRRGNRKLLRYRIPEDEIIFLAKKARELGIMTTVLQSGEDPWYSVDKLIDIIKSIKEETNQAITLCIGERPYEEYKAMKAAGADRFLLKHETASSALIRKLRPDSIYENRFRCLRWLRELGFQAGSGNIVGLPGQTIDDLARDILIFQEYQFDMIGIGPFIPHPETPLANTRPGELDRVLKILAITRIVTKDAHLPATTAVGTIHPEGRRLALQVGANIIMPNITPPKYREHYQVYPDRVCLKEEIESCIGCLKAMISSLGRQISSEYGHSLKIKGRDLGNGRDPQRQSPPYRHFWS